MRTVSPRWPLPIVFTFCVAAAAAQQFLDPRHPPAQHVLPPVDVTGDGLPDLVFVGNGAVTLRANDGQVRFPQSQALFTYTGFAGVFTPADLDGDNDVDFVVFDGYQPNAVALNVTLQLQQPGGTFTTVPLAPIAVSGSNIPMGCVAMDIDNDGDRDLVLHATGPAGASLFALRNDGVPVFTEVTSTWFGTVAIESPLELAAADVDGDARTDLLVRTETLHVLHNSGVQFVDETALRLPPGLSALTMLVGNLDGDTDPDVVFAEPFTNLVRVLQNQNGVFADVSPTHAPATPAGSAVCLLDVDRDGDRDLFAWQGGTAQSGDPGFTGQVLRNDGTGRLLLPLAVPTFGPFLQQTVAFTAIDLEGDGDQDLAATGAGYALLRSSGAGAFTPDPAGARRAGLAFDVDGDGYRDLLDEFGVRLSRPGDQWVFTPWGGIGPSLTQPAQVGDIDGDGDLDLVTRQVWRNNGAGVFTVDPPAWVPPVVPMHSALGDLDGDGDLDVVSAGGVLATHRVDVFLNNGLGQFVLIGQVLGNRLTTHLSVGDANGDTRADILVSGRLVGPTIGCEPQLLLNQGNFVFTALNGPPLTTRMRLVDLRGNGQIDVLADASSSAARAFRLQAGAFVEVTATMLPPSLLGFVAIGDVDQDGDVDLVGNDLWRHNGTGGYTQEALGVAGAAQLVDVDGDRDLDLVTGTTLLWNREHHLHLPLDAHVGRSLRIEVSARPGHAVGEAAFVALSLQQLSPALVLPLGHVHLASIGAVIVVLPPNGSGFAATGFVVPNAPALVGVRLFLQSLHLGPAGDGLSNLATTVIE